MAIVTDTDSTHFHDHEMLWIVSYKTCMKNVQITRLMLNETQ